MNDKNSGLELDMAFIKGMICGMLLIGFFALCKYEILSATDRFVDTMKKVNEL